MRAQAILKNVCTEKSKQVIIRNLARILDMRVVDFNTEARLLTFLCTNASALEKVKKELQRLGYSIQQLSTTDATKNEQTPLIY